MRIHNMGQFYTETVEGSVTRWLDYFFNIFPFTTMQICPNIIKLLQEQTPNFTKPILLNLQKLAKDCNFSKVAKFCQIWSHWLGWQETYIAAMLPAIESVLMRLDVKQNLKSLLHPMPASSRYCVKQGCNKTFNHGGTRLWLSSRPVASKTRDPLLESRNG